MSSAEIKLDIIHLIDQIEDRDKLAQVYKKLLTFLGPAVEKGAALNENLEESLRISIQQLSEGKGIPHEAVMAKYRKKYSS